LSVRSCKTPRTVGRRSDDLLQLAKQRKTT